MQNKFSNGKNLFINDKNSSGSCCQCTLYSVNESFSYFDLSKWKQERGNWTQVSRLTLEHGFLPINHLITDITNAFMYYEGCMPHAIVTVVYGKPNYVLYLNYQQETNSYYSASFIYVDASKIKISITKVDNGSIVDVVESDFSIASTDNSAYIISFHLDDVENKIYAILSVHTPSYSSTPTRKICYNIDDRNFGGMAGIGSGDNTITGSWGISSIDITMANVVYNDRYDCAGIITNSCCDECEIEPDYITLELGGTITGAEKRRIFECIGTTIYLTYADTNIPESERCHRVATIDPVTCPYSPWGCTCFAQRCINGFMYYASGPSSCYGCWADTNNYVQANTPIPCLVCSDPTHPVTCMTLYDFNLNSEYYFRCTSDTSPCSRFPQLCTEHTAVTSDGIIANSFYTGYRDCSYSLFPSIHYYALQFLNTAATFILTRSPSSSDTCVWEQSINLGTYTVRCDESQEYSAVNNYITFNLIITIKVYKYKTETNGAIWKVVISYGNPLEKDDIQNIILGAAASWINSNNLCKGTFVLSPENIDGLDEYDIINIGSTTITLTTV